MITEVSIANSALAKVGAERIISMDDNNERARLCKEQLPKIRDALLRGHPWNFAQVRVTLAELPTPPVFEFTKSYQLPADCLRVLKVDLDETYEWKIEGKTLVTDASVVSILYLKKETDPNLYDANFVEVLATTLAGDICYSLVQSATLRDQLKKEARDLLREARSFDAQEGTPQKVQANYWRRARY